MKKEMAELYGISPDRIITVYNPVDEAQIDASVNEKWDGPADVTKYVAIGRVQPQKDYATLLRAFAELLASQPQSLLYIIGDDTSEYAAAQKSLAAELGIDDKVSFMGFQSNPYKYLCAADCFVLSSEYEGLPNVMLEALYLGVPIVATESIPFVARTLGDGKYGICVPVGDVSLFAKAMSKAAAIQRYESHNVAADTFSCFMEALNSKALR
jgi:glycosyltransferase involved in cell wall biosynthesis